MIKEIDTGLERFSSRFSLPTGDWERVLRFVRWKETPYFPAPGRSAWYSLREPISAENEPTRLFRGVKLKGLGYWNPPILLGYRGIKNAVVSPEPRQPSCRSYDYVSEIRHIGIDNEGNFKNIFSERTPLGGMKLSRAINEYRNAEVLYSQGVSSIAPLAVACYGAELAFEGESMGAFLGLTTAESPFRLHPLLVGESGLSKSEIEHFQRLRRSFGIRSDNDREETRLEILRILCQQIGRTLNSFSRAGLYRHSGGLDNFQYSILDSQVLLTDLDSSLRIEDRPESVRFLEILRDLASVIYKFYRRLAQSNFDGFFSVNGLRKYDPISQLIMGYFPGADSTYVRAASGRLLDFVSETVAHSLNGCAAKWLEDRKEVVYLMVITLSVDLLLESDLSQIYPVFYSKNEVVRRCCSFLMHHQSLYFDLISI